MGLSYGTRDHATESSSLQSLQNLVSNHHGHPVYILSPVPVRNIGELLNNSCPLRPNRFTCPAVLISSSHHSPFCPTGFLRALPDIGFVVFVDVTPLSPQTRYLAGVVFLVRRRRCGPGNVIQDEDALRRLEEVRGLGGRPP